MADEEFSGRLTHAQVIESALVTIGYAETLPDDLQYAAEVLRRATAELKAFDRSVNFHEVSEKEKMKAVLTLNTMYALEQKLGVAPEHGGK
jgi:hypothetical protein